VELSRKSQLLCPGSSNPFFLLLLQAGGDNGSTLLLGLDTSSSSVVFLPSPHSASGPFVLFFSVALFESAFSARVLTDKVMLLIKKERKGAGGVALVVEHLPSKHEVHHSNPSTAKKKGGKEGRKDGRKEERKEGREEGRKEGTNLIATCLIWYCYQLVNQSIQRGNNLLTNLLQR
jgi:hypothetical protein